MNGIDAAAGVMLLVVFLFAVMLGVVAIASRSINREDKHRTLKGAPPDRASGGTRRLVGVGRRDMGLGYAPGHHPGEEDDPGRGLER